jgi:hypothetical protein
MHDTTKRGQASVGGFCLQSLSTLNDQDWGTLASLRHAVYPTNQIWQIHAGSWVVAWLNYPVIVPIGGCGRQFRNSGGVPVGKGRPTDHADNHLRWFVDGHVEKVMYDLQGCVCSADTRRRCMALSNGMARWHSAVLPRATGVFMEGCSRRGLS